MRLARITAGYRDGETETEVLHGTDLVVHRGETVSLVGVSGSGKSTLLGVIGGLIRPTTGTITLGGQEVGVSDEATWARLRAESIGMVQQNGNLIPFLTAAENVELAMMFASGRRRDRRSSRPRARDVLGELGLGRRVDHLGRQLSGGEAQRAAIAVALVNEPELLLADEITGELDRGTADQVMNLIFDAAATKGLGLLFVTHDRELAGRAQRQLRLVDGLVVAA